MKSCLKGLYRNVGGEKMVNAIFKSVIKQNEKASIVYFKIPEFRFMDFRF